MSLIESQRLQVWFGKALLSVDVFCNTVSHCAMAVFSEVLTAAEQIEQQVIW